MPKLSIIVPIYNVEQYLRKCVDSILNQTFTDFELLLIDDGSPDNCGKICDEYALKDTRVRVVHKENGGVSSARNLGLREALGEYISFVDPDDWIDQKMYTEVLEYVQENSLDIVLFDFRNIIKGKMIVNHTFDENKIFIGKEALEKILKAEIVSANCNMLFKKYVWTNVTFPVGRFFEDEATLYKAFYKAQRVGYIRKAYYNYLRRENSAMYLSFRAERRFDRFLALKERWEFAKEFCCAVEEKCKTLVVKTALSTETAVFGCSSTTLSQEAKINLEQFLLTIKNVKHLNAKNKILLWGVKNCKLINIIYAKISYLSKKVK